MCIDRVVGELGGGVGGGAVGDLVPCVASLELTVTLYIYICDFVPNRHVPSSPSSYI